MVSTVESQDQEPSVGELVRRASEHASTLVRAEIELAKTELTQTVKRGGIGGGLLAAAGVVLLFSVPFLFVMLDEVLVAVGVWRVLALIGRSQLRKVRKPERTLQTAKDTAAWARHPTSPSA